MQISLSEALSPLASNRVALELSPFFWGGGGRGRRVKQAQWRSNLEAVHILAILRGWLGF